MRHAFCMSLEARDATLGRFRAYRLAAGPDLFGLWLVDVTYGRIGTRGTSRRYVAEDEKGAQEHRPSDAPPPRYRQETHRRQLSRM